VKKKKKILQRGEGLVGQARDLRNIVIYKSPARSGKTLSTTEPGSKGENRISYRAKGGREISFAAFCKGRTADRASNLKIKNLIKKEKYTENEA